MKDESYKAYVGHSAFRTEFLHCIQEINGADALVAMGYTASDTRAEERLASLIASPVFDLDVSHFNFRYSSTDFLRALCRYLQMEPEDVDTEIERLKVEISRWNNSFCCFLCLDTGFKRTHQSNLALSVCESQCRIILGKTLGLLPRDEQIAEVCNLIERHQDETAGYAGIWGTVQSYLFYYALDSAIRFSIDGEFIEEFQWSVPEKAELLRVSKLLAQRK